MYHSEEYVGSTVDTLAYRGTHNGVQQSAQLPHDGLHDAEMVQDVHHEAEKEYRRQGLERFRVVVLSRLLVREVPTWNAKTPSFFTSMSP